MKDGSLGKMGISVSWIKLVSGVRGVAAKGANPGQHVNGGRMDYGKGATRTVGCSRGRQRTGNTVHDV